MSFTMDIWHAFCYDINMSKKKSLHDTCQVEKKDSAEHGDVDTINAQSFASSASGKQAMQELHEKLLSAQREAECNKDAMLRALADLENFRKRMNRERSEIRDNTIAEVIETLLPILDNFEFGLSAAEQHGDSTIVDGFKMILDLFRNLLSSYGLREIYPLNDRFDLNCHECVRRVSDSDKDNDVIVAVDRKGYFLNDKLLRAALVAVAHRE